MNISTLQGALPYLSYRHASRPSGRPVVGGVAWKVDVPVLASPLGAVLSQGAREHRGLSTAMEAATPSQVPASCSAGSTRSRRHSGSTRGPSATDGRRYRL